MGETSRNQSDSMAPSRAIDITGAVMTISFEFFSAWMQARVAKSDRGASLVEYALLVALIAVVCILAITFLGKAASSKFSGVGSAIR